MILLKKLLNEGKKLSFKIFPEERSDLDDAFIKLQWQQRGKPESMFDNNHNEGIGYGTGMFTFLAEHIGDLIHRLAYPNQKIGWGGGMADYGLSSAKEKVDKTIGWVLGEGGMMKSKDELLINLTNNYNYYKSEKEFQYKGTFKQFVDEFNKASKRYADAYKTLKPITILQQDARNAAIALGEQKWDDVGFYLRKLKVSLHSKNAPHLYFTVITSVV